MLRRLFTAALVFAVLTPWTIAADPPAKKKKETKDASPVIAHIKLSGDLEEKATTAPDPIFGGAGHESFKTKLDRIAKAKKDENVKALYLEFEGLAVGMGKMDELRHAITDFKSSGKKVFTYAESYGPVDYLIAVSGDMIATPESGGVDIHGMHAAVTFYKDFFEKLKLKADFLQMGDYKGAAEPFLRSSMSPEFRKQLETVIDDWFEKSYVEVIAKARPEKKWTADQIKKVIDTGMFTAKGAVEKGLVDRLVYPEEFVELMKGEVKNAEGLKVAKNYGQAKAEDLDLSSPFAFLKLLNPPKKAASKDPKVAVIYAVGVITSGKGGGGNPLTEASGIASTSMVETINEVANDETVKAVVLRVDSPGGSALASDLIWNALIQCNKKKPVIASMGDTAASGGYYISAGCRKVYAEPGTLTGSIGVVGGKIVTGELFDWIGMKTDIINRGANAGIMTADKPWNDAERKVVRESMQDVYDQFLQRVLDARSRAGVQMTREKLLTLAGGRVWTGRQAKANGLVDELGTLDDAIAAAKKMAGQDGKDLEIQTLPKQKSLFEKLAESGGAEARLNLPGLEALKLMPQMPKHLKAADAILRMQGEKVWLIQPFGLELN
ncbi:MAG: signal peptide peptidase SppA [Gemmataceae bacterium]